MAQVTVTAQYVADTASYVRAVRQATDSTNEFARNLPQVEQAQDKVKTSTIALGAALGTLGAQVFARATSAVMKYANQGIQAAKDYEQTIISIEGIFAGAGMSMEEAAAKTQSYLAELRDFAAKTPFELPQTLDAVKRLLSIGYAADDVKDRLLPTIGDIVAALGQPPSAISAVVYAFGQMKSAGRVLSQDLMQIGNALPGFNAKMAIANEMFQGDFGAMTKAMETGALDSSVAIDVIITAMQKFGGAAGAMDRQSRTLAGVLSTFSDTVNNALIDGLIPSIPLLSETLNEVMPAVEGVATAFAQALGPALIDGAGLMGQMAPVAASVLPPIMELISNVTMLADALMIMSPVIIAAADAVGVLAGFLSDLPGPVLAAVGGFLIFRVAMKKLGLETLLASTQMTTAMATMRNGAKVTAGAMLVSFTNIRVGVELMKVSFVGLARSVGTAMKAAAVAVRGFLASLGPVGLAIIGASVAFEVLAGKSAATEELIDRLKDTINETTGAFDEFSAKALREQLRMDLSPQDQQTLRAMGLSVEDMAAAIVEGGPAIDAFNQRMQEAINANSILGVSINNTGSMLITAQRNFTGAAGAASAAAAEYEAAAASEAAAAQRTSELAYASFEVRRANNAREAASRQKALSEMTAAEQAHLRFVEQKNKAHERAIDGALNATKALNDATKAMAAALDAEATYDNARAGILDLTKELKEGDKTIKGYSQAALDNRAAIRDAAQGYIDYANSLSDPLERQAALEEGTRRISKALEEAGIDPSKSKIIETLKAEATESKKTVDEFAKQREDASRYGNEVGVNFIDGIVTALEQNKGDVDAAAKALTKGMEAAANEGIEASSPSRASMRTARNFIDGLVKGIKQDAALAKREVSELGQGLIDALQDKLDEFASKMESGIAALSTIQGAVAGTATEFGLPSQIMESMGAGASASGIIGQYEQLSGAVQEMFAPFLDKEMVPKKIRRQNRKALNSALGELRGYTAEAVRLVKERERIQQDLSDLDSSYAAQTKGINDRFNELDKAAAENTKRIEQHYAQLIPRLQNALNEANAAYQRENAVLQGLISERNTFLDNISKGFRSFLNNLKTDAQKASRQITRVTKQMRGGIQILTEETLTEESTTGGGFASALQGRLAALRDFTTNVRALLARGVDPALVRDFVSAGVDAAGETVAALAAGSDQEIAAINAAQSELGGLISSFQQTSSAQWFDYGIAQQQAIVTPLQIAAEQARVALEQAQIAREMELAAARAHQETLRLERQAELEQARLDYEKQRDDLIAQGKQVEEDLTANAQLVEDVFLALRDSMRQKMIPTGRRIINGIIQGLRDREGALYGKADAIANEVKRRIEAAFQIASPSKVTRTMGQQIADGLALGMQDGLRNVSKAAVQLADQAMVPITTPDFRGLAAAPPMSAMRGTGVGGSVTSNFNVTVNAGMGADKQEIARVVVDSLKQYERRNGPIPITVRS